MSGGQQTQNTLYESGIGWGIIVIILGVLVWLFWIYFHMEVREMVRWIRYSEMWVVSWFVWSDDYTVKFGGRDVSFVQIFQEAPTFKKAALKYQHLAYFNAGAMQPLKMPFLGLIGLGCMWCMFSGPGTQYRRRHDIETLIEFQSKNFPVISPFKKFNPSKQPPRPPGAPVPADLPLFAEALGPEEWLAYNSIPAPDGDIDEGVAWEAFQKQLGDRWKGTNGLADYKQVLLAAFCLKAARKRALADDMLGRLAKCWSSTDGLRISGKDSKLLKEARAVLKNKDLAGKTLAQANHHAFETTAMMRALAFAREEGGVLAPATFVWLRAHDRNLWYPLNNMGRQSYHMEALGAMSHYKAERLTQRPIPVPKLEHSVQSIKKYMKSMRARPIPALDYSRSQKRGVKKAV